MLVTLSNTNLENTEPTAVLTLMNMLNMTRFALA